MIEAEKIVQDIVARHVAHDIDHGGAQNNIQHQIGNTFISVLVTV